MTSVAKSTNTSTCLRGKVFVQKYLNHVSTVAIPALGINGVATQYTTLGFLHEMPPPLNTVVKAD